ncbi:MAG: hypothetical protein R2861_03660 [Desulfobacterales bacterium]
MNKHCAEDILWMLEKSLSEGFKYMIFSNGLMPEPVKDFLEHLPQTKTDSYPAKYDSSLEKIQPECETQQEIMQILGRKVIPGNEYLFPQTRLCLSS